MVGRYWFEGCCSCLVVDCCMVVVVGIVGFVGNRYFVCSCSFVEVVGVVVIVCCLVGLMLGR